MPTQPAARDPCGNYTFRDANLGENPDCELGSFIGTFGDAKAASEVTMNEVEIQRTIDLYRWMLTTETNLRRRSLLVELLGEEQRKLVAIGSADHSLHLN